MSNETMQDFAPDPVICPDCHEWVRPYQDREYDGRASLNCPKCGFQCCAIKGWPEGE